MQKVTCNYCGSSNSKDLYRFYSHKDSGIILEYNISKDSLSFGDAKVVKCLDCGFCYLYPRPDHELIRESYAKMQDNLYFSESIGRAKASKVLLEKISSYVKGKGRLLDIGCSAGILLNEAKKLGWKVYGVELSSWAVKKAKSEYSIEVFMGELQEAAFPDNYFDCIIMNDSLEHMPDVAGSFREIKRILRPEGVLCISTPDIGSILSKLMGKRWWGIKQSHLVYFDKHSIAKFLNNSGFRILGFSSHSRFFSLGYLLSKISHSKKIMGIIAEKVPDFLKKLLCRINFGDQMEVYAVKKRSLSYFSEPGEKESFTGEKMKTIVVLPAFNAATTLEITLRDIPKNMVDDIILVDDASTDNTVEIAQRLNLKVFRHNRNMGYGANQKTCYQKAIEMGAGIIVMVHPDYQYDPKVIPELIRPILNKKADAVFGSRMMKGGALEGGMPIWKHNANILLTALENVVLGTYLTEYHSGFRAYSVKYLKSVNFMANSNNFVFDTEIIVQGVIHNLRIEEVPIHTRYFEEASTIKLFPAVIYGLGILLTMSKYLLHKLRIIKFKQFL